MAEMACSPSLTVRRYRGGCQCGAVVFHVRLDLGRAHADSPSVWEREVQAGSFELVCGDERLHGLQFSEASVHHFFCDHCGTRVFSQRLRGQRYSVDLKCLHVVGEALVLEPAVQAPLVN